ncbi:hypothetical protein L917_11473, partial [Phytophthora nicotianae]
ANSRCLKSYLSTTLTTPIDDVSQEIYLSNLGVCTVDL